VNARDREGDDSTDAPGRTALTALCLLHGPGHSQEEKKEKGKTMPFPSRSKSGPKKKWREQRRKGPLTETWNIFLQSGPMTKWPLSTKHDEVSQKSMVYAMRLKQANY